MVFGTFSRFLQVYTLRPTQECFPSQIFIMMLLAFMIFFHHKMFPDKLFTWCILLLFQLDLKPSGRLQIQIRFFSENEGNFTWLSSCIWQQNVWRHEQIHVMHLVHFVSLCTVYIPYIHVWKEWKREKNYKHILFDVLHARMWIALAVLHY